jgi:hypothetical protein
MSSNLLHVLSNALHIYRYLFLQPSKMRQVNPYSNPLHLSYHWGCTVVNLLDIGYGRAIAQQADAIV